MTNTERQAPKSSRDAAPSHARAFEWAVLMILWLIQMPRAEAEASPISTYQTSMQRLVDQIAADLVTASTADSLAVPHSLEIHVTSDRAPFPIESRLTPQGGVRISIPAGFFVVADVLIDATLMARSVGREDDALEYAEEVTLFATRSENDRRARRRPQQVCDAIEWNAVQCESARQSARYRESRSNMMTQSVGWIIAHQALIAAASGARSHQSVAIDALAANWSSHAGVAPLPIPALAILYAAALDSTPIHSNAWRCRASEFATAGITNLDRLRAEQAQEFVISEAYLSKWRAVIAKLRTTGNCSVYPQENPSP